MSGYGVSIKNISVNTRKKVELFQTHTVLYSVYMYMNIFFLQKHNTKENCAKKRWMPFVGLFVVNIVQNLPDGLCFVSRKKQTNKRLNKLAPQNKKVEKIKVSRGTFTYYRVELIFSLSEL